MKFQNLRFITSAFSPKNYPILKNSHGEALPEIAVAGRSNVGKSTLINHLFQMKGYVKTSSIPGKTQSLNFFAVDESGLFVDLPGYGYAKVPEKVKASWGPMIESYLNERHTLKLLLFLFDIRRNPTPEDLQMIEWIHYRNLPTILILTKVDKVKRGEREKQTQNICRQFNWKDLPLVHYSATKNEGRPHLIALINKVMEHDLS